jgi:alanine racemase
LSVVGVSAHPRDGKPKAVEFQLQTFNEIITALDARNINPSFRLLASSPLIMRYPNSYLNAVDPGRMLYGIRYPDEASSEDLKPILQKFATRLIWCGNAKQSDGRAIRIGVVPIGAADGLNFIHAGRMLVRGKSVPIIGRPSLEHTRLDLTELEHASIGDEAVAIGRQGAEEISAAEISERHGIRPNQIALAISSRVPRLYV